jgi:hypothetical protein
MNLEVRGLIFKPIKHDNMNIYFVSVEDTPYILRRDLTISEQSYVSNVKKMKENMSSYEFNELLKKLKAKEAIGGWYLTEESANSTIEKAKKLKVLNIVEIDPD